MHGVRSGEELDKQQLMGTSKRTNWTHLWDPALTAQCSGVIFSRYVVTCMETCTSSHHRNLSAAPEQTPVVAFSARSSRLAAQTRGGASRGGGTSRSGFHVRRYANSFPCALSSWDVGNQGAAKI